MTVRITDQNGLTAPRADNRIKFSLQGPGEIVATDNGDATNFETFSAHERQAFNGYCLVIIRGKPGQPGKLTLRAEATSLSSAEVNVQSVRGVMTP